MGIVKLLKVHFWVLQTLDSYPLSCRRGFSSRRADFVTRPADPLHPPRPTASEGERDEQRDIGDNAAE